MYKRQDEINEKFEIKIDERGKPRGVDWSVGEVKFISSVPGEGQMGPFRVGQAFSYARKDFVLVDATPQKVTWKMKPEGELIYILAK